MTTEKGFYGCLTSTDLSVVIQLMSSQATYAHLFRLNRLVVPCIEIRFGFKLFCI